MRTTGPMGRFIAKYGFVIAVFCSVGCSERDIRELDVGSWLIEQMFHVGKNEQKEEFRRQAAQAMRRQVDMSRIPPEVVSRVAAMTDIKAESLDELLINTGLMPFRDNLLIIRLGTLSQELWVCYGKDMALHANHDPISLKIVGQVRNVVPTN